MKVLCSTLLLLLGSSMAAMYHDFVASAGGYSVVMDESNHPRLQQAAEFALTEAMELQKYSFLTSLSTTSTSETPSSSSSLPAFTICQAYQQVVAGMNLRMVIMVQDTDGSCLGAFATTIYDRFGELSVTDWSPAPVDCDTAQRMETGSYVATGALESFFRGQP